MTIKDIARESGYAVGTVSRVLNNNPRVSEDARRKILAVVAQHGYQPNANAKHLKQQVPEGLALIVKGTQNALFADLLDKLQPCLEARGYTPTVYYNNGSTDELACAQTIFAERRPCGLFFIRCAPAMLYPGAGVAGHPCLLLTNNAAGLGIENLSSVSVDDRAAAAVMIEQLYAKGHRVIGIIGDRPETSRPSQQRLDGCLDALQRLGVPFDFDRQYRLADFSMQGGYAAAEHLLAHCPGLTAIFAMSDLMAVGAIRAIQDHGLRVPQDIAVAGYDGIALGRYTVPRLTTIRQNTTVLAERAADILLRCIEETPRPPRDRGPLSWSRARAYNKQTRSPTKRAPGNFYACLCLCAFRRGHAGSFGKAALGFLVQVFLVGIGTVVPVGILVGNLILQLAADVIIPVCFAEEAVIVIVVAGLHALGHLGSGQPRRVGGDAVQIVADAVVGVLIGAETVDRKADIIIRSGLHDGHTVGSEHLGIGVRTPQGSVQDAVVAALQRVVAVGVMVEPDVDAQGVRLGFQRWVRGQGAVHRVRFLRFNAGLGVVAGGAPLADGQGQQCRRADDAERERRTQHGEPVKFHLHVGLRCRRASRCPAQ